VQTSPLRGRDRRDRRSRSKKKLLLVAAGLLLVVGGFLLGLLPVVPGTPIVLSGLVMVTNHSPRGRLLRSRFFRWARRRGLPVERLARLGRRAPGRRLVRAPSI
jgi:hypothetical protein